MRIAKGMLGMAVLHKPVRLATIGAPHGVRGEVRLQSFTADPLGLTEYAPLCLEDGTVVTIASLRPQGKHLVARLKGVDSREAAEKLTNVGLFVDRSQLADDVEDDEFYHSDLIGIAVRDETGAPLGRVAMIHDFGAGDIVEIRLGTGRSVMVPFTKAAVPAVSLSDGLTVDRALAGLLPDEDEDDDAP
jgi:16S rRNA processing protein RimM